MGEKQIIDLISNQIALVGAQRIIVDIAMYFGLFVIVTMALNFQYGNAGVPNMGCAVQVITGGFVTSAITTRVAFIIAKNAGIKILPYSSNYDWVYNNNMNVGVLVNGYLKNKPILSISLFLFTLAMALLFGAIIGWIISLPAIKLTSTDLIIVLITMSDMSNVLGRNIPALAGGTLGIHIPNLFAWYPGDRSIILSTITLFIGLICFLVFKTMLNSPYGRLMRSIRENPITVNSVGKNVVGIRRNIIMFASGITAICGTLLAFYYSFVTEANYARDFWTFWPWLMLMLGGPGNNAGTFLGCALVTSMRRIIIVYKWVFERFLFFPVAFFERILLGLLLLVFIIFRPQGLIPEKLLSTGINYKKLISEEEKVDWTVVKKTKRNKRSLWNAVKKRLNGLLK